MSTGKCENLHCMISISRLLLVALAFFWFTGTAIAAEQSSDTSALVQQLREEKRDLQAKVDRAEIAKDISEAKADVIAAGRDKLAIDISIFGILLTALVVGFGFATYNQAAVLATNAAQKELREIKNELEALRHKAAVDVETITQKRAEAISITDGLREQINRPAQPDAPPLPTEQEAEFAKVLALANAKPRKERSPQDFRILMLAAEQKGDWAEYLQLAEGMAFLHGGNPDDLDFALFGKAFALGRLARHSTSALAWEDYLQRCPHANLNRRSSAFYNWGTALSEQAEGKTGPEADALLAEAGTRYAEAVRIKPDTHEAYYNWGAALSDQAKGKTGPEADALFAQAGAKYAEATRIKPDYHKAFNNWGTALLDQAKGKTGPEADALFAEAGAKYAEATRIKPDYHEAFYNWGTALSDQARSKTGPEADALFAEAGAKYAKATRIKPDYHKAYYNWGIALSAQAKVKTGPEADALLAEAGAKYALAEAIRPGSAAYNRACLAALRGDAREAAELLRTARTNDPHFPGCDHIARDTDFDALRQSPEFQAALADIGCGADAP